MSKVIGIDISKQTFDVALLDSKTSKWQHHVLENNKLGFKKLCKFISEQSHVVMEASGSYYLQLALYLEMNNIKVSVVNPLVIRRYSQMKLQRAKTDKKDAQTIAMYGIEQNPELWQSQDKEVMELKQLYSTIELLSKQVSQTQHQLEAHTSSGILSSSLKQELNQHIKTLKRRKEKLETRFRLLSEQTYGDTLERLATIPGIGKKTAVMLTVITNNFKKFDNYRQLIAYVGLSPRKYESGTSVRGRGHICKMGQSQIRKLLYMCSWSAKKLNKACIAMYERLIAKGKAERVVKIAIANKLLKQAFAIAKNKEVYNENFMQKVCF
ncbi:MAG: IS110 family transposase [Chitinophagales bacterium]|nr:IS110 family transposase [Chitinophagales bacterium]MCB9033645.1 IS110 family transposase [Chitinophagales bacterium]MCB9034428.1 IS110 family transposase [Chitinophagales bacterium]MCB9034570.1 IS110 family transposase [Chitinophagales bacterium]